MWNVGPRYDEHGNRRAGGEAAGRRLDGLDLTDAFAGRRLRDEEQWQGPLWPTRGPPSPPSLSPPPLVPRTKAALLQALSSLLQEEIQREQAQPSQSAARAQLSPR